MSQTITKEQLIKDFSLLAPSDIDTYLRRISREEIDTDALLLFDLKIREHYSSNPKRFDCWVKSKLSDKLSSETKSTITEACLRIGEKEKAMLFTGNELNEETRNKVDNLFWERAIKQFRWFSSFHERDQALKSLIWFRSSDENSTRLDIAKYFEENKELENASKVYSSIRNKDGIEGSVRVNIKLGRKDYAANTLWQAGQYQKAAEIFNEIGNYEGVCRTYLMIGRVDEAIHLAKKKGLTTTLADAWKRRNSVVSNSIRTREARKKAKNLNERVMAMELGEEQLKRVLRRDINSELDNTIRESLERLYDKEIGSIHYGSKSEAWAPSEYSEEDYAELDRLDKAKRALWIGTKRYDKLADYEKDPEKKIELYLKAGDKNRAISILENKARELVENRNLEVARKIHDRIREISSIN